MTGNETVLRRHAAWLCVAVAYLIVFPYFPKLNNPNENVRIWMTRAIVAHGTFAINDVQAEWGEVADRASFGTRLYSSKAPGTSLLGVPVMFVHDRLSRLLTGQSPSVREVTWTLRVFAVALPLCLFLLFFARQVERETGSPWARDLLVVGLGLGTMMYTYGVGFVGHAPSAAAIFSSFLFIADARSGEQSNRRLIVAGLLAGLAVVFEYQTLFAAAILTVFAAVRHKRRAGFFLLGALGPAVLLGLYHTALFGKPWEFPYGHIDDDNFRLSHTQGFFGLGRPRAKVLKAAFFDVDYGLFIFSPFLAPGLVAAVVKTVRTGDRAHATVLAVTCAMAVFLCGMTNWRGGWCAGGPRYIAAVVPFLAWAIALTWKDWWGPRPVLSAGLAGLVVASVVTCGVSGVLFPHYPVQFNNPLFDVAWRLLKEGFAPHGLGTALGLRGLPSLLPAGIVFAAAGVFALRAPRHRLRTALIALGVAALVIFVLSLPGRRFDTEEERTFAFLRGIWEPHR